MPVHPRTMTAVLRCLQAEPNPVSAEEIAERTAYSVQHIWRTLIVLRNEHLFQSWRPKGSHSLIYQVDESKAIERGLLP